MVALTVERNRTRARPDEPAATDVLAEGDLDSVQNDQRVIEVYLGR